MSAENQIRAIFRKHNLYENREALTALTDLMAEARICDSCSGTGKVWKDEHDYLMKEPRNFTCPTCKGSGILATLRSKEETR